MTKKKSTKRALISSLLILAMCFTMLAGTTFAWFTDSVESGNNIIKSGKLDIDLLIKADGDQDYVSVTDVPTKAAFNYQLWEPGYTSWANAKVVNKGNLALKYTMKIAATGEVSKLAEVIDVYYAASEIAKPATRPEKLDDIQGLVKIGSLKDAINGTVVINDKLEAADEADFATIVLHMQEDAGNEYQELSIGSSFKFVILATQWTKEVDAFDNQYDALAEFPGYTTVDTAADLISALQDPEITNVKLDEDLTLTANDYAHIDRAVTLDMDGHTITYPDYQIITVDATGDLTITGNGTINGPVGADGAALDSKSLICVDGGKLTVLDGTFNVGGNGSDGMYGIYALNGATVVLGDANGNGPTMTSHFAPVGTNYTTAPANITINGGTYTAEANPANNEWWSYFCAPVYAAAAGNYTINGGTFNGYYGISTRYLNNQNIAINGGTFNSTANDLFVDTVDAGAGTDARVITKNGTALDVVSQNLD